MVLYGLSCTCIDVDNSILAFSAASLTLCIAILSFDTSIPCYSYNNNYIVIVILIPQLTSRLNSCTKYPTRALSKSSPPKKVSPFVDLT